MDTVVASSSITEQKVSFYNLIVQNIEEKRYELKVDVLTALELGGVEPSRIKDFRGGGWYVTGLLMSDEEAANFSGIEALKDNSRLWFMKQECPKRDGMPNWEAIKKDSYYHAS